MDFGCKETAEKCQGEGRYKSLQYLPVGQGKHKCVQVVLVCLCLFMVWDTGDR